MSPIIETLILSLGAGLVILALGIGIPKVPRTVAVLVALGVGLITFVIWPKAVLVEVPDLSNLSRDEASIRLADAGLQEAAQPQESPHTRPHHVIAQSQNPLPGTKVKRDTVIRFSVNTDTSVESGQTETNIAESGVSVSVLAPAGGNHIMPARGADGIFRIDIEGTIVGASEDATLLLWLQPIDPPSDQPGWYLQRLPSNGIRSISGDRWRGICQIGNQQWPPNNGDVVDVVATLVPTQEVLRLQARQGPLTLVRLPGTVSNIVRLEMQVNP